MFLCSNSRFNVESFKLRLIFIYLKQARYLPASPNRLVNYVVSSSSVFIFPHRQHHKEYDKMKKM